MRRRPTTALVLLVLIATGLEPRAAQAEPFSVRVNKAIERAAAALLKTQRPDGSFGGTRELGYALGHTALTVYALLHSGVKPEDPAIQRSVTWLRGQKPTKTYDASALLLALHAVADAQDDQRALATADWLVLNVEAEQQIWSYPSTGRTEVGDADLSNTQLAVLGLWVAERRGHTTPDHFWMAVAEGVLVYQNADGGFRYSLKRGDEASTASMTTAGITILTLASERLGRGPGRARLDRAIRTALTAAWSFIDRRFRPDGNAQGGHLWSYKFHKYYLYGIERIATLAKRKEVGGQDWYRAGARTLLASQGADGTWGLQEDTCLSLLFLRRATLTYVPEPDAGEPPTAEPAVEEDAPLPTPPGAKIPYMREWLLLGPLPYKPGGPPKAPFDESAARPREKARTAGQRWLAHQSQRDVVHLSEVLGQHNNSFSYAFTWLHASEDTDVVLWFGPDDAGRVFLDGQLVHDDPFIQGASVLGHPIPLRLAAGPHRLLVRVEEWASGSGFYMRIALPDGTEATSVRASLTERAPAQK